MAGRTGGGSVGLDAKVESFLEEARAEIQAYKEEELTKFNEKAEKDLDRTRAKLTVIGTTLVGLLVGALLLVAYSSMKDFIAMQTQVIGAQETIATTRAALNAAQAEAQQQQNAIIGIRKDVERQRVQILAAKAEIDKERAALNARR